MEIRRCAAPDVDAVLAMIRDEGGEWECYCGEGREDAYRSALESSITYLAFEGGVLCGFARCRDDDGLGLYVYDLLVAGPYRGRRAGRELLRHICARHRGETVYVLSDVDAYYEKLGLRRAGSVFVACER